MGRRHWTAQIPHFVLTASSTVCDEVLIALLPAANFSWYYQRAKLGVGRQ
jgi:hypothetical protein